jgi:hypothetical protein
MKKLIVCTLFIGLFACSKKEEVNPVGQKYTPISTPSKTPTYHYE